MSDLVSVRLNVEIDTAVRAKLQKQLDEMAKQASKLAMDSSKLTRDELKTMQSLEKLKQSELQTEKLSVSVAQQKIKLQQQELNLQKQISSEKAKQQSKSVTPYGNIIDSKLNIGAVAKSAKDSADIFTKNFTTQVRGSSMQDILQAQFRFGETSKSAKDSAMAFGLLDKEVKKVSKSTKEASKDQYSLGNMFKEGAKKAIVWTVVMGAMYAPIRALREGISIIVELDHSLTELNKVTDVSAETMSRFVDDAYEAGEALARTGKEVIDATTVFAKAGYTLRESLSLSEQALLLSNIGDGMDNVSETSSELIAIMKGYNLTVEDTAHVVDVLNEVSNKYAVDTNNLTDGLQRASGTLGMTGTSLEELTGILTGSYEVLRNMEKSSTGLITISQRLRGIGEDGEALDGLLPTLEKDFMSIAKIRIGDGEGGLRSTFDILKDMAEVWPSLNEQQRQYLGELAAGKRQVPVLNSILLNWKNVEAATKSALDSQGSALKENEKVLNSIEGRLKSLASSIQQLWKNTISSDVIKAFINMGNGIIKLVDAVGLLNIVFSVLFTILGARVVGTLWGVIQLIPVLIKNFSILGTVVASSTAAMAAFQAVMTFGVTLAILGFVSAITKAIEENKRLIAVQEELVNSTEKTTEAQKAYLDAVNTTNLNNYNSALAEQNALLQEQIDLLRKNLLGKLASNAPQSKDEIEYLKAVISTLEEEQETIAKTSFRLEEQSVTLQQSEAQVEAHKRAIEEAIRKEEDWDEALKNTQGAIDETISVLSDLSSAYEDVNSEQGISKKTILDLITQYPQLAGQISKLNDAHADKKQILSDVFEYEKQIRIAEIQAQKSSIDEQIRNYIRLKDVAMEQYAKIGMSGAVVSEILREKALGRDATLSDLLGQATPFNDAIRMIQGMGIDDFGSGGGASDKTKTTGSSASSTKGKTPYEVAYEELQYLRDMDIIDAKEYYSRLEQLFGKYESTLSLEDQRKVSIELHNLKMGFIEDEKKAQEEADNAKLEAIKAEAEAKAEAIRADFELWKVSQEQEISAIDSQIEALKEKNNQLDIEAERKQRLIDVEKAKQALENAQLERNTRVLKEGRWQMIASPKAIREAQDALNGLQTDYSKWETDIRRDAEIASLEAKKTEIQSSISKEDIASQMKQNSALWFGATESEKQQLADQNLALGAQLGWSRSNGVWYDASGKRAYAEGGINSFTGTAMLHGTQSKPEMVLNNNQSAGLFNWIKSLPKLMTGNNQQVATAGGGITIQSMTVQSNNADEFMRSLRQLTILTSRK